MATKGQVVSGLQNNAGCLGKARHDEPVFVLRAQDATAPDLVRHWAVKASREGTINAEKLGQALIVAADMEQWQTANGCKIPD